MQLPFYVTKTTAVTREAAIIEAHRLACRYSTTDEQDRRDLIDFCLSGPKSERVPLSLGTKVRLKPSGDWYYATPVAGTVCLVSLAIINGINSEIQFKAVSDGDIQRLSFPNHITDLSEWIEVL